MKKFIFYEVENMNKIVILYQSKYGSAKKYAEWLSEELSCDIVNTKHAQIAKIQQYDTVILGGGIYAGGIAGLSFIKKHYDKLKDKKIIVFAVGASPYDEKSMKELRERHFKGELEKLPCFYCRGAWNEEIMSLTDRMLCGMLKKAVSKKDPANYEPWEAALIQAMGTNCDWTSKENLAPIIEIVRN